MFLMRWTTEKDPRQGSPLSAWTGGAIEKDWLKRPLVTSYKRPRKRLWWGHNSCKGGSLCPCTVGAARVPASQAAAPPSCQPSLGQSCHRQTRTLRLCMQGHFCSVCLFVTLWTVACQASLPGELSRLEYWSIQANTGCHTLLEHCNSCCLSWPLPWVPVAARNPVTQASAPPPHLAFTGADPSPPGQPQEQTPVDGRPTCRGGNKTTVETQGQCG